MAVESNAKGNAAFAAGKFTEAINHFTDAINLGPTNHVLYSNRSAAYASLNQYSEALSDAKETVDLKPDWSKGYSRLGAAHHGLKQYDEAVLAYKKGLEVDPSNETLKSGLKDAESAKLGSGRPGMRNLFGDAFGSDMWAKLTADPATRMYMQQPDFVNMMKDLQLNPRNLNLYLQDQRVMQTLSVLLNVKMSGGPGDDDVEMPDSVSSSPPKERKRPADEAGTVKEKKREAEVEPEPMRRRRERKEREFKERKANAQKEMEKGYKKKDFETAIVCYTKAVETAIECYTKAVELDDGDTSFLRNRAAVYLDMGKATIEAHDELDEARLSRPLNDGKEADPTTKLGNLNSLSASATTFKQFITQQNAIQQHILDLLESRAFNVNQVDSFSVKTALSVLNRMVDDGLIVKGCQLWCIATDLFEDAGKRELFVSMPDDDGRIAWLTHIAKKN